MSRLEGPPEKQRYLEAAPILVGQAQDNLAEITILRAEQEVLRTGTQREVYRLEYDVYQPKIRLLEEERNQATQAVREAAQQAQDKKQQAVEDLQVVILQVGRILDFLRVKAPASLAIDDDEAQPFRGRTKKNLGYLFDDHYLKIKLFIVENNKPKNKYSLVAMGRCLFGQHLLKLPRGYVEGLQGGGHFSLEAVIVDKPSIAELQPWREEPGRQKVIINLTGGYETVKAEYQDVVGKYTAEDFKELMTDRCGCGYFYTIFEDFSRRDEAVTCPLCRSVMERVTSQSHTS